MMGRQKGFSLLEAIVAMTILATSGLALFSWFSVTYDGVIRVEEIQDRHELMDDLHAYFATLNIRNETSQQMQVNGFDVAWTAELVEQKHAGKSGAGGASNFDLGLYDVAVEISRGGDSIGEYQLRLVGYEKVRDISDENQGS